MTKQRTLWTIRECREIPADLSERPGRPANTDHSATG
jgi:hypothetical protein